MVMKHLNLKYLFWVAALATSVQGCTKSECLDVNAEQQEQQSSSQAISFSSDGVASRATVNENCAQVGTMGVYSYMYRIDEVMDVYADIEDFDSWKCLASPYYHDTPDIVYPFFTEDTQTQLTVTYSPLEDDATGNAGSWGYGWTQYWPSDPAVRLAFYAFAPQGRINRVYNEDRGIHDFNHTISASALDNYDLMWADVKHDMTSTTNADGTVDISLEHALTRLTIEARIAVDAVTDASVNGYDYTDKYNYERFGINGITFYGVASQANVVYYDESGWDGTPRWAWSKDAAGNDVIDNRIDLTATQGNTLVSHSNSLNYANTGEVVAGENYGQIRKISKEQWEEENGVSDPDTFTNVMYVNEDGQTYSIFAIPQNFSTDSPDATARVRLRHYDNYMISVSEYVGQRTLFEGLDENNTLAFATKPVSELQDSGVYDYEATQGNDPYLFGIQFVEEAEYEANIDGNCFSFVGIDSDGIIANTTFYYKIMTCYDASATTYEIGDLLSSDGSAFAGVEYFVVKDMDGTIYETGDISLSPIFTSGWNAGDWYTLQVTFDATFGSNITVPLSVEAQVLDWIDQDVEVELDEQLVVYCDQMSLSHSATSVVFYTNATSTEITASSTSCTVGSVVKSSSAVDGIYTCTIPVSDLPLSGSITISVVIPNGGMNVTKVFTLNIE